MVGQRQKQSRMVSAGRPMYCSNCGSPLGPTDRFYTRCGTHVAGSTFVDSSIPPTGMRPLGITERIDAAFKA
jgi:hypothetical protein